VSWRGEGEVVSSTTRKVGSLIWDAFVGEEEKRRETLRMGWSYYLNEHAVSGSSRELTCAVRTYRRSDWGALGPKQQRWRAWGRAPYELAWAHTVHRVRRRRRARKKNFSARPGTLTSQSSFSGRRLEQLEQLEHGRYGSAPPSPTVAVSPIVPLLVVCVCFFFTSSSPISADRQHTTTKGGVTDKVWHAR
jgi:hypothetical protein